jgi:hypothetical protein
MRARRHVATRLLLAVLLLAGIGPRLRAQDDAPRRLDSGRFTVVYFPADDLLARALAAAAVRTDTFPWLPRPRQRVLVALAPDAARFRAWAGPQAPEWGAALAFPESRRIIMQGRTAGSDAGDPVEVLRHELAHLALHEVMGDLPPRWFDEGYASVAAREWRRDDVLAANVALVLRGTPTLARLDEGFQGGSVGAQAAYAFSYRAVTDLAALDPARGLTLFFQYWRESGSMDQAIRRAFGITLAGFERDFQGRTRRSYGALALFADLSLVLFILSLLMLPFFVSRRRRDRRRLKALLAADAAAERAEQATVLAMLLGEATGGTTAPGEGDDGAGPAGASAREREP